MDANVGEMTNKGIELSLIHIYHWLQVLALVEEHSVPVAYLILPVLLPLAQSALLQQAVSLDDELRSCSLEKMCIRDRTINNVISANTSKEVSRLGKLLYYFLLKDHKVEREGVFIAVGESVSYTHLDVYKRQVPGERKEHIRSIPSSSRGNLQGYPDRY